MIYLRFTTEVVYAWIETCFPGYVDWGTLRVWRAPGLRLTQERRLGQIEPATQPAPRNRVGRFYRSGYGGAGCEA